MLVMIDDGYHAICRVHDGAEIRLEYGWRKVDSVSEVRVSKLAEEHTIDRGKNGYRQR